MTERRVGPPIRSWHIVRGFTPSPEKIESGEAIFLGFDQIALPLDEKGVIPAVSSIVDGRYLDFRSEESAQSIDWVEKVIKKGSLFSRVLASIVRENPGEESKEAAAILAEDLRRFKIDSSFLKSPELKEFLFKLTLGVYAWRTIHFENLFRRPLENKNAQDYKKVVEFQVTALERSFANLTIDDLGTFVRFEDIFYFHGVHVPFVFEFISGLKEYVDKGINTSGNTLSAKERAQYKNEEDSFQENLINASYKTWLRLSRGWTEEQVSTVVSLLPQLRYPLIIAYTMSAFEDNLLVKKDNNQNKQEWTENHSEGLLFLLKWKWEEPWVTGLKEEYPNVFSRLEETFDFAGFSVPKKYLPSTAIAIIANLSKNVPDDEFVDQLKDIHNLVLKDKQAAVPWFLTLVVLKNTNPPFSDSIDKMVGSLDSLPEGVRDTFLNKIPGKIWLRPDGKLFAAKSSKNYSSASAFPVFTSLMEEIVVKEPEQIHKSGVVDQERSIKIAEVELVPFFGEIGKVDSRETRQVVLDFFEEDRLSLNEGVLSIEFGDLEKEWKMKGNDRELLYINELNKGDKFAEEAKRASIEAVYIHGNTVMIILNKNGILEDSRSIRLGIKGRIDESGLLQIEGMDHTFLGEKEHLFLNNLALHFATQPLFGVSGIPDSIDKDVISKMNGVAASWKDNPLRRINNLPRIERNGGKPYVSVRVSGCKEPVLMCERSVH